LDLKINVILFVNEVAKADRGFINGKSATQGENHAGRKKPGGRSPIHSVETGMD
jgi:hypothetical protein